MRSCSIMPEKGQDTFKKLKKEVGYERAVTIFNKITGKKFTHFFGHAVTFDSDGVPTFESIMKLPIVRNYIGQQTLIDNLKKNQPHLSDNMENVSLLVNKAQEFNNSGENNDLVAFVDYDDEQRLTLNIVPRTKESEEIAINQFKIHKLNNAAAGILGKAGLSIDELSQIEKAAGRVGVTEFRHLSDMLGGFTVILKVANNLEGFNAISEEFAHFVIGVNNRMPLVKRSIDFLMEEKNAREVLGDQFDKVYEFYNGNMRMVAEEAAGHIFREVLLEKIDSKPSKRLPLFTRMVNAILNLFKGINPAHYKDTLDSIRYDYGKFAEDIISGKKEITKKDIQDAKRLGTFNALSEKVEAQIKALQNISILEYKAASLQRKSRFGVNHTRAIMDRGDRVRTLAEEVQVSGESMKAITNTLKTVQDSIDSIKKQLKNLNALPLKERQIVLRNALTIYETHDEILNEIDAVMSEEFMTDESIRNQQFMMDDAVDALAEYRNGNGVETVDTSTMSSSQIIDVIEENSKKWNLSDDVSHYIRDDGKKALRVTSTIEATEGATPMDPNNPYVTPSTNIGTGIDELVRDFFDGRLTKVGDSWQVEGKSLDGVYPNASKESLNQFADQLQKLKEHFDSRGITIVARDIKAEGIIETIDGSGKVHSVNVVGTLDLIGYDKNGNFYIYDMKTHRGEITDSKKEKWSKQLSLYKKFIEEKYGIRIKGMSVIPISVSYPAPNRGSSYEVSTEEKPSEYRGEQNNQLMLNGSKFSGAKPFLEKLIPITSTTVEVDYAALADDPTNGLGQGAAVILDAVKTCRQLLSELKRDFRKKSKPVFMQFLAPFVGTEIEIADPDNPGKFKKVSIEELIDHIDVDITWAQKMLATMADVPNTLLQVFDKVIKEKKHLKRQKTIETAQRITALGMKYEKLGIRDYSFMFEEDKKEYINDVYDKTAYDKAYKKFADELEAKYGRVSIGSPEYKAKRAELIKWVEDHTVKKKINGRYQNVPNPAEFPSKYDSLSATQKAFYDEWMELKEELDEVIGRDKTHLTNSIKIRKSGIERVRGVMDGKGITNLVEAAKASVMKSYDDETSYAKGVRDAKGNERMTVPLMYLNLHGGNSEDISTDVIGTLIAYADMAYNYEAMSDIVDGLELGKQVIKDNLKIGKKRRGKVIMEKFTPRGRAIETPVTENTETSNIMQAITNLLESKVYGRHQKEISEFMGMDLNKVASRVTRLGSAVQLGFNFFANLANIVSGVAMTNIEAAALEYFTPSDLRKADQKYFSLIGESLGDIGSRATFGKLTLLAELFSFKMDFQKKIKGKDFTNRNFLTRFFGPSIQFIGQEAGDHWLYYRASLALLNNKAGLVLNGEPIDIDDAFDEVPIDASVPEAGNKLVLKEGVTKKDGSAFTEKDIAELSGQIWSMNKRLFGIYNTEDSIEARRYILGKFAMQYRDWMPALYRHRFGKATTDLEGKRRSEGFYRTTGRFGLHLIKDLKNSQMNISQSWNQLEEHEKANVRRALAETCQLMLAIAIATLLKGDPKERPWAMRTISYISTRAVTELGALTPLGMWSEGRKLIKSPFAATSVIDNIDGLKSLLWPPNYFDEIKSGNFKGHSSAYRAFLKSPFSLWYNTLVRHLSPEKAENYYDD